MNIIQQPDPLSLSLNLKEFLIASDSQVSFILRQGDAEVLSQRYDPPVQGYIVINLKDVIHGRLSTVLKDFSEPYEQPFLASDFIAVIDGTEVSFKVIRGGVDRLADSATNFLTQNFLTWQPSVKPVTYYSPEFLTYYALVPGTIKLRAYFTDDSGTVTSQTDYTIIDVLPNIAYTIPLQYSMVAGWLEHKLPSYYDVWVENTTGQRLTYIQRYYAEDMRSEQEQWFLFENSLGGIDTFRAYGNTTFNGEHTHNLAEIDEVSQEYRIDTERKFQKNTGHLNDDERKWLLDFFPSKSKFYYTGSQFRQIVVIESNVSYTDKELPSNYTFTFKYADARPLLNLLRTDVPAEFLHITVPSVGSFTVPPRLAEFLRLPLSEGALFPVQSPYSEEWGIATADSLVFFVAEKLSIRAGDSGDIGHKHNNIDLLNLLSYKQNYLYIADRKAIVGYADKAEYANLAYDLDEGSPVFDILKDQLNRCIRKDHPDSTLYPVDFMGGLLINSKRIDDVIRYYDEDKPVATDANIYSAVQTDQRIEDSLSGLDDRYLRKDKEDTAHKHITFEEGVTVYQLAELMNLDVKNLATIAKAVVSILRSSKFVDGFSGEGYQIWQDIATGDWNMTLDRLTVRKVMTIYELVMQKIRSVGGMVVVSAANGKVKSVERIGNNYLFTFEDANTFQPDDLMRCQVFSPSGLKYYWVKVSAVSGESVIVPVSEFAGAVPTAGDECVLMGNVTNKRRQNLIIISATEDGQPRFDCLNGVKSKSFEGCLKVRVGNLDGIGDSRFPADMQPSGHGLYGNNCFLTGVFVLANGKDVLTMFSIMEGMIRSEISTIRNEVNAADNYLGNASFGADLSLWSGTNDIRLFSVNGRLLSFNNNFYSDKRNFADIVMHEGKRVLRIKNSSITQYNTDLARHPEFDSKALTDEAGNPVTVRIPRRFFISFSYMVTRPGILTVYFENERVPGDPDLFEDYEPIHHVEELSTTEDFRKMEISGMWNGKGNFYLSFTGDIYLYSLALTDNPLAEMEERFNMRFEATEEKIQANLEEIRKNGARLEEYHSEFLLTARNLQLQFTEDLSSAETRITEAYKSYVTVTAEKLEAGFKSDLGNAEKRITEAYGSAIEASAKGLRLEFTADLTDMEKGITEAYKSHVKFTAENLKAEFTTDLTDLRTGLTEAYNSAIEMSAKGLRTEFNSSIDDLDGRLTSHTGSFHVTAEKIEGMVAATDNINNTIKTAGWITTTDGNRLWAAISTVNDISEELTRHEGSFHVTADKIEGIVSDVTNINGRLITHTGSFHVTAEKIQSMVTATDNISNTIKTAGWITTAEGNTWWASKHTETAAANAAQAAIDAANAAAGALSAAQNAASAAANAQGKADSAYDKASSNATAITQTNSSISAIAARFNPDGTLKEGAGWVTTTDAARLYARAESVNALGERVTVAEASITTFITRDEANNAISSATIQADRINFTGKTIINGKFVVDMDGNLILNDIIANNGVFSGALNASVFRTPFRTIRYEDTLSDGAGNRVYYIYLDEGSNLDIGGLMTTPDHEEYVYLPVSSASYGARVILYNSRPVYTRLGRPALVRNRMCEQFRNLPSNATQFRVDAGKMVHLTFVNETSEDGSRKSSYWYVEDPENCVGLVNAAYTKIYERFE